MTVFAQHPTAIIRGRLLSRPQLLTGKLRYIKTVTKHFQTFLYKMNVHYVTYLICPHLNDHLSINCNAFYIIM